MTTYVPFNPINNGNVPWKGQFTLDGQAYTAQASWNLFGQRWYLSLFAGGTVVWFGPIIGSPLDFDIPLAPGVFQTSTLLYRSDTGNFEVSP